MADVTRALACAAESPWPTLAHQVSTLEGLHAQWADVDGHDYRSLINEGVHACGVQRAAEAREDALKVIQRLCSSSPTGHAHLLKCAPELVAWAACRKLPVDQLHRSDRKAKDWSSEVHGPFPGVVAKVARDLVARYGRVRRDSKVFIHEARDVWLDIIDPSSTRQYPSSSPWPGRREGGQHSVGNDLYYRRRC